MDHRHGQTPQNVRHDTYPSPPPLHSALPSAASPTINLPLPPPPPPSYNMSSPAPLLRPPIPGSRQNVGSPRAPRLGLAIPTSPNVIPLDFDKPIPVLGPPLPRSGRPALPKLSLATPMGSTASPQDYNHGKSVNPPLNHGQSASGGSESSAAHSRSGSFGRLEGAASGPTSAGSFSSNLSFASQYGLQQDPVSAAGSTYSIGSASAISMEREGSMHGLPDISQLSLERGRTADVEDLDDDGWRVASQENRITELGSLGEGAGGAVTKCRLKGGTTIFALKIITTTPDPDVKKQIVRELGFNKECASSHICTYYGAFVDASTATISIAMEFCEGGSLDSIYREVRRLGGRTGEKVLGKVAEGVLNGLTYLHSKKIIHRDIKPSNILLCRDGQVKLCDFGVSGEFGTKGDANTFIGTSYYMAPERITGQSYTITSDVWSTGVTLLEVAQHRFPFPADGTSTQPESGMIDLLTYIVRQPIPRLKDEVTDHGPNITWSDNFKYFIECCLEKEPTRRASPWRMLEHPWMIQMKSKKVNMARFLAQVWGWEDSK